MKRIRVHQKINFVFDNSILLCVSNNDLISHKYRLMQVEFNLEFSQMISY
jgi:hypothetical protein